MELKWFMNHFLESKWTAHNQGLNVHPQNIGVWCINQLTHHVPWLRLAAETYPYPQMTHANLPPPWNPYFFLLKKTFWWIGVLTWFSIKSFSTWILVITVCLLVCALAIYWVKKLIEMFCCNWISVVRKWELAIIISLQNVEIDG